MMSKGLMVPSDMKEFKRRLGKIEESIGSEDIESHIIRYFLHFKDLTIAYLENLEERIDELERKLK